MAWTNPAGPPSPAPIAPPASPLPDGPTPAPPRSRSSRSRRAGSRGFLVPALTLLGLLALSGWNLTRSDAVVEARKAYIRGDLPTSLGAALDHLGRQPWSREASRFAALCYSRLDYADEAEPYYRRAGRLSLDDQHVRAYGLVRGNHRQRAIQAYHEILKRWPDNVTALRRVAAVEISLSNDTEVLTLADRLVRLPGGAAIGYTLQGVVQHNQKNYELAVAAFEKVLELDPNLRQMPLPRRLFWGQMVNDLMAIGRTADARRYLNQALAETPDAYLMMTLGQVYDREGKTEEAERWFRKAIEGDPNLYSPYLALGQIELFRKRYDEALTLLRKAVALAPRQREVLYALDRAYRLSGRVADAARVKERMDRLRPAPGPVVPGQKPAPLPGYAL